MGNWAPKWEDAEDGAGGGNAAGRCLPLEALSDKDPADMDC
jgi:hypothetical protein